MLICSCCHHTLQVTRNAVNNTFSRVTVTALRFTSAQAPVVAYALSVSERAGSAWFGWASQTLSGQGLLPLTHAPEFRP